MFTRGYVLIGLTRRIAMECPDVGEALVPRRRWRRVYAPLLRAAWRMAYRIAVMNVGCTFVYTNITYTHKCIYIYIHVYTCVYIYYIYIYIYLYLYIYMYVYVYVYLYWIFHLIFVIWKQQSDQPQEPKGPWSRLPGSRKISKLALRQLLLLDSNPQKQTVRGILAAWWQMLQPVQLTFHDLLIPNWPSGKHTKNYGTSPCY